MMMINGRVKEKNSREDTIIIKMINMLKSIKPLTA